MSQLNNSFSRVVAWGDLRQAKFASSKIQLLGVSRTTVIPHLHFNVETLVPKDKLELLGVTYDHRLAYKTQ